MSTVAVDLLDPTPPYEQLRRQFTMLIETGQLGAGERLPPVRQLARDLGLATGTVGRAYQELEAAGLVRTRRGGGTTVSESARHTPAVVAQRLAAAAETYAVHARSLGVSREEAVAAVERALGSASAPAGSR